MPKGFVPPTAGKHFHGLQRIAKERRFPDSIVFVEDSSCARHHIKKRIINQNLIDYRCEKCNNDGTWNGEPLVLQLEHKNGVNNDNRIENLGFLCPNCHSQTKTYSARNRKNPNRKPKKYV